MKIVITYDRDGIYPKGYETTAEELIDEFCDGLNTEEPNDKELQEWLHTTSVQSAVEMIADIWGLKTEEC